MSHQILSKIELLTILERIHDVRVDLAVQLDGGLLEQLYFVL